MAPADGPLSYEMRYHATWVTYLIGFLVPAGGAVVVIAGGPDLYPVTIGFVVVLAAVFWVAHLRRNGELVFRVDHRGIEFVGPRGLFVAWPDVVNADLGWSGEDRALAFQVRRGSVVAVTEDGAEAADHLNRPPRSRKRPSPFAELIVSELSLLDRAALRAVIRTYAPHVTGRFGTG